MVAAMSAGSAGSNWPSGAVNAAEAEMLDETTRAPQAIASATGSP